MSSIVLAAGPAERGICGSGWRLSPRSCSSSRARTWRTSCWRAPSRGAASSRSGCRSGRGRGAWRVSTSPRACCWRCSAASRESSLAYWALGVLMQQFPLPPAAGRIDVRLLVFALGASLLTGAALWHPSRDPRGAARSRSGAQRLARRRRVETEPHAPCAGRAADRLVAGAPRRRRALCAVAAARERDSQRRRRRSRAGRESRSPARQLHAGSAPGFYESALSRLSSLSRRRARSRCALRAFSGRDPSGTCGPGRANRPCSRRLESSPWLVPATSRPPAPGCCAAAPSKQRTGEAANRWPW